MNESVVRFALKKILRAADLDNEGITCHSLRHTYASLMIAARVDSVFLSRQLGHATPAITWAIYVHLFDRTNHANATR
jgi:integrase